MSAKKNKREFVDDMPPHAASLGYALQDIDALFEGHGSHLLSESDAPFVPEQETVFMRAAATLICSAWEAYVEDLARGSLQYLLDKCNDPIALPPALKRNVAMAIKKDLNELAPWQLAGEKWKSFVLQRFETVAMDGVNRLNSPQSTKIRELYRQAVGVDDITTSWQWEYFDKNAVCDLVDYLVKMRCDFAHGRKHERQVTTPLLVYLRTVVTECGWRMNNYMVDFLREVTKTDAWPLLRTNTDWKQFTKEITG